MSRDVSVCVPVCVHVWVSVCVLFYHFRPQTAESWVVVLSFLFYKKEKIALHCSPYSPKIITDNGSLFITHCIWVNMWFSEILKVIKKIYRSWQRCWSPVWLTMTSKNSKRLSHHSLTTLFYRKSEPLYSPHLLRRLIQYILIHRAIILNNSCPKTCYIARKYTKIKFKRENLNEVVAKMGKKNSLIRERQEDISGRARHREGQPSAATSSKEKRKKDRRESQRWHLWKRSIVPNASLKWSRYPNRHMEIYNWSTALLKVSNDMQYFSLLVPVWSQCCFWYCQPCFWHVCRVKAASGRTSFKLIFLFFEWLKLLCHKGKWLLGHPKDLF